jgi:hypothetical protein
MYRTRSLPPPLIADSLVCLGETGSLFEEKDPGKDPNRRINAHLLFLVSFDLRGPIGGGFGEPKYTRESQQQMPSSMYGVGKSGTRLNIDILSQLGGNDKHLTLFDARDKTRNIKRAAAREGESAQITLMSAKRREPHQLDGSGGTCHLKRLGILSRLGRPIHLSGFWNEEQG